jgi:sigma-B regulation protein RsbU (phosphoserine phosphatase)
MAPDLSSVDIRMALRRDAANFALGSILTVLGVVAVAVFGARKRVTDRSLLWFGVFTGVYGIRLILWAYIFRSAARPVNPAAWDYLAAAITYSIPLLIVLFLLEVFPGWARILRWLRGGFAAFAVAGISADQILGQPGSFHRTNNGIVIIAFVALLVALYRYRSVSDFRPLWIGGLIFFATVLFTNVWTLYKALPLGLTAVEPIGFTCFLAAQGTVVIRRLFEREERLIEVSKELEVAHRIQTSILPREAPSNPLVSIAARYVAMTAVAGDFYDFLVVDENRIGVLIADVSGHRVPAALIASMVKIAVSAQLPHAEDPAHVLAAMNGILCGKMQSQFVSAAYLFLDLKGGFMRYGGAGHPPLLHSTNGIIDAISENGLLLGLFPSATYTMTERKLIPGSRFLLYTDGLAEASNASEQFFGEERVHQALHDARGLTAEQGATLLVERVREWTGDQRQDDLTVIVVDIS